MKVIQATKMTSRRGNEEHFVGNVWLHEMLPPMEPNQLRANLIYFEPCARTNWHSHPEFQILYVVAGNGRIKSMDGSGNEQASEISAGDIVHNGEEKHWHGAAPDSYLIHIAINLGTTCWMGVVDDEEYMRGFGKEQGDCKI